MKTKWALFVVHFLIAFVLIGCDKIAVLDPKGPQAQTQANVIWLSIGIMSVIVVVVCAILVFVLVKYRDSKLPKDYEPPYIEGNRVVETIIVIVPILIVAFFSVVTIITNNKVEATPQAYKGQDPLIVYASSSNWKWHFSYPEENIETVNYLYIPTNRPLEFKLYSFGPITSFWIPQLGGQKYAMSDMVTTLHLAADEAGEMMGRNANFSGVGFAENSFYVEAMSQDDFDDWVTEVKETAEPLTEEKFQQLLKPGHLGQLTFTGTHLPFSPAPEGEHAGHNHGKDGPKADTNGNQEHDVHEHDTSTS
ncbi:cytochrome aa3 quinol oxidase subunit II [Caldibacillus lycopersici]|uniref:Quinol oxidase polypeptide II n=1 Tax=Perspicuibacillus lycopersici TaxID=1325689 RepID=A0AAE3IV47_9BACI|nr:cytochrome aa3 quinol oxidase subunit II [Perspicuibacillus lycopersici]MCU9612615.1 cytochrome aa3 quinol oxidase subunit II [Perspicuibacillus lycopersici]